RAREEGAVRCEEKLGFVLLNDLRVKGVDVPRDALVVVENETDVVHCALGLDSSVAVDPIRGSHDPIPRIRPLDVVAPGQGNRDPDLDRTCRTGRLGQVLDCGRANRHQDEQRELVCGSFYSARTVLPGSSVTLMPRP